MKRIKTQRLEARKQELRADWATCGGKLCYRVAKEQGSLGGKGLCEGGVQQNGLFKTQGGLGDLYGCLQEDGWGQEGGHAEGVGGI